MITTPNPRAVSLLDAILPHVAFDGWNETAFRAAAEDMAIPLAEANAICPRGAVDLAILFHKQGDAAMVEALRAADLSDMRIRDKVAHAIRLRLDMVDDKEAVRRGTVLFALPHMAPEGSKLIWGTADAIWTALGDTSDDVNWYTKRATLGGVYSATVLFWLGDTSEDHADTWHFLDRRIDNIMQIEKIKAQVKGSPTLSTLFAGPSWLLGQIKAPVRFDPSNLPGSWTAPRR